MKFCEQCKFTFPNRDSECTCGNELKTAPASCCPATDCTQVIAPQPELEVCPRCHNELKLPTLEIWLRKVVEPKIKKDPVAVSRDTSRIILEAEKMKLGEVWPVSQTTLAAEIDRTFIEKTGVSRTVFYRWFERSVKPVKKYNTAERREKALERALEAGMTKSLAERYLPPKLLVALPPTVDKPEVNAVALAGGQASAAATSNNSSEADATSPVPQKFAQKLWGLPRKITGWFQGLVSLVRGSRRAQILTVFLTLLTLVTSLITFVSFVYAPPVKPYWDEKMNNKPILKDIESPDRVLAGAELKLKALFVELDDEEVTCKWTASDGAQIDGDGCEVRLNTKNLEERPEATDVTVSLIVKDKISSSQIKHKTIKVRPHTDPEIDDMIVDGDLRIYEGDKVKFRVTARDIDGDALDYTWSCPGSKMSPVRTGDGSTAMLDTTGLSLSAPMPIMVCVKVTDRLSRKPAKANVTIFVLPRQKTQATANTAPTPRPTPTIPRLDLRIYQAERSFVRAGDTVRLTAHAQEEGSADEPHYEWTSDNGQYIVGASVLLQTSNIRPNPDPVTITVRLKVSGRGGGTLSPQPLFITVGAPLPPAPSDTPAPTPSPTPRPSPISSPIN